MKKHLWMVLPVLLVLCSCNNCNCDVTCKECEPEEEEATLDKDLAILYTNDVHCEVGSDTHLGYAELAQCKKDMVNDGNYVTLVDCGDSIQGGTIGTLSNGLYLSDIMQEVGYDVAIPGNHEFDYGMDNFLTLEKNSSFPYVCCNFMDLKTNETVLDPYYMCEYDDVRVAYIGITTPKTITSSTPKYFQDDSGNFIYGFCQDSKEIFYDRIQDTIEDAKERGADYVVGLSHLGTTEDMSPFMSTDVIANTTGIDVMLDGHSHSFIRSERVANKDGKKILLSSTGTKFESFGILYITKEGNITTELVEKYASKDTSVSEYIASIQAQYADKLNEKVASTNYDLTILDPETKKRMVRNKETNLGDLCADAFREYTGSDIAVINGGGVRANIPTGDITYGNVLDVMPYNNEVCEIEVTGKILKEALELSVYNLPIEFGGFLQVSGMSFDVDSSIATPVVLDSAGMFLSMSGENRVSNIKIGSEDLVEDKTYTLSSITYILTSDGNGYTMFDGCTVLKNEGVLDNQVLINYIQDNLSGVVGEQYKDPYGDGRINIK
ncbi:MAG: bifunctional UDP-sugar hydrolase/5'-nucleotidase [Bacilli bacterium]